ncbi:MAG TPA: hypothetical protein VJN96_15225 [Vicinamibacterales bacterium]|nr:hypothetical protein [Vicinamibacterales bacterium]
MKADQIAVDVTLESQPASALPVSCEVLARTYVGDLDYTLVRETRNRDLFLVARGVSWRIDVPALLASFAEQLRAWDRQRDLMLGVRDGKAPRRLRAVGRKKTA